MKKFLVQVLIFSSFVVISFIIFMTLPIKRKDMYAYLRGDCLNHGIWIYDRIFVNPKPAKVVFIGSSRTMNGVSDDYLEKSWGDSIQTVNLAYCRLGRNLQYVLLKDLLSKKNPSKIILEIKERDDPFSHPIFPNLASPNDILYSFSFSNKAFWEDCYKSGMTRFDLLKSRLWGDTLPYHYDPSSFGHSVSTDTFSFPEKEKIVSENLKPISTFPKKYLSAFAKLCELKNIKLYFLYLPGYHSNKVAPAHLDYYSTLGEILMPPDSIIMNRNYFHDLEHVNKAGAEHLSEWLSNQL